LAGCQEENQNFIVKECHIFSFHSIIYYRQAQAQYFRDSGEIADFFLIEIQSQQGAAAGDFCPY
jgi:hypothetical protein